MFSDLFKNYNLFKVIVVNYTRRRRRIVITENIIDYNKMTALQRSFHDSYQGCY